MEGRATITALLGLAFIASHNLYLYCLWYGIIDVVYQRAWYSGELLLFIMPLILMGNSNSKSFREIQFRNIVWFSVSLIMLMIVLNSYNLIPMPYLQFYYFNGLTFAFTIIALLFSDKNGNF